MKPNFDHSEEEIKSLSLDITFLDQFNQPTRNQGCKAALNKIMHILTRSGMAKGVTDAAIYYNTLINFLWRANFMSQEDFQHHIPLYRSTLSLTTTGAVLLGMSTAVAYSKRDDGGDLKDLHSDPHLKKLGTMLNYLATFYKAIGMSAATVITCNDFRLNNIPAKIFIFTSALMISFIAEITKFENVKINHAKLRKTIAYIHSILRALVMYQSLDHWPQHILTAFGIGDIGSMTQETLSILEGNHFQATNLPLALGFFSNIVAFGIYVISNRRALEQMFTPVMHMPSLSTYQSTLEHTPLLPDSAPPEDKLARAGTFVATHTTLTSFTALINDVLLTSTITLYNLATYDDALTPNNPGLIAACLFIMLCLWYLFKNVLNQANLTIYTNRRVRLFSLTYALPPDWNAALTNVLDASISSNDGSSDSSNEYQKFT